MSACVEVETALWEEECERLARTTWMLRIFHIRSVHIVRASPVDPVPAYPAKDSLDVERSRRREQQSTHRQHVQVFDVPAAARDISGSDGDSAACMRFLIE